MSADQYLQRILSREAVDTGPFSPVLAVQAALNPILRDWARDYLVSVSPSGSFAKGTANKSGTDIDLFISLSTTTPDTLREIYNSLFSRMQQAGYRPVRQNVSIQITQSGYKVDLVPGKRQNAYSEDHSLYRRRADTWTKTNVQTHINHVRRAGRTNEIRILKLWRDQKSLDFPSFYLELTAIDALSAQLLGTLSTNVRHALIYLRDRFASARVVDPANTNNIISDDLTAAERGKVVAAASKALGAKNWSEIVQ